MEDREQSIQTVERLEITLQDITGLMGPLKQYHSIFSPVLRRRE
jgi:hypothetical protein